jgi:hypothetical protein
MLSEHSAVATTHLLSQQCPDFARGHLIQKKFSKTTGKGIGIAKAEEQGRKPSATLMLLTDTLNRIFSSVEDSIVGQHPFQFHQQTIFNGDSFGYCQPLAQPIIIHQVNLARDSVNAPAKSNYPHPGIH